MARRFAVAVALGALVHEGRAEDDLERCPWDWAKWKEARTNCGMHQNDQNDKIEFKYCNPQLNQLLEKEKEKEKAEGDSSFEGAFEKSFEAHSPKQYPESGSESGSESGQERDTLHEIRNQIVKIEKQAYYDLEDQKIEGEEKNQELTISATAEILKQLDSDEMRTKEVLPIVIFGQKNTGKTTVANFLSCALDCKNGGLLFLPAYSKEKGGPLQRTEGLWSSPILTRQVDGKEKNFVIFDIEGYHDQTDQIGFTKLVAALSEVTSIFIMISLGQDDLGAHDKALVEHVFPERKKQLLKAYSAKADTATKEDIRVADKPHLFILPRTQDAQYLKDEEKRYTPKCSTDKSKKSIELSLNPDDKNFEDITWLGAPIMDNVEPFGFEPTDTFHKLIHLCRYYSEMDTLQCTEGKQDLTYKYKLFIDELANMVFDKAKVRRTQVGTEGVQTPLLAPRLARYLADSIEEMNKIGPLPETHLWKSVSMDHCHAGMKELADKVLGDAEKDSAIKKMLAELVQVAFIDEKNGQRAGAEGSDVHFTDHSWKVRKDMKLSRVQTVIDNMKRIWNAASEEFTAQKEKKYKAEIEWSDVKKSCDKVADDAAYYHEMHQKMLLEAAKGVKKDVSVQMILAQERNIQWWNEHKLHIIAGCVIGLLACVILAKVVTVVRPLYECATVCCTVLCTRGPLKEPHDDPRTVEMMELNKRNKEHREVGWHDRRP